MSSKTRDERELLSKPGDSILETIGILKMSQVELSERLGKTPSKVNDLISGKEPITVNTALQLEKVLGINAQFWLNREMIYREKLTRIEQDEALEECQGWLKEQPVNELRKMGYISSTKVGVGMADEFLKFYGVASVASWESVYAEVIGNTAFRKSAAFQSVLSRTAAWLRIGELELRQLDLGEFDKAKFKDQLAEIKKLVRNHPEDFAMQLQKLCRDVGVGLIYTSAISKAPISGATRWVAGNPLIQMTDRYKMNDQFWHTFFHEAGHVVLHGKKEIFLEELEGFKGDADKEKEADAFAYKWLIGEDVLARFNSESTEKDIRKVAREMGTHPAVILAHLQHHNILPYSFGTELKIRVHLDFVINGGKKHK